MLVFDVSGSMAAADVQPPTRMEAAKATATEFVLSQPETVQIGIVSFSGSGFTVQTPTNDAQGLLAAIDRLQRHQPALRWGRASWWRCNTIAVDAGSGSSRCDTAARSQRTPRRRGTSWTRTGARMETICSLAATGRTLTRRSVIVLLTDGENTKWHRTRSQAAQAAAERSVRIDATGFWDDRRDQPWNWTDSMCIPLWTKIRSSKSAAQPAARTTTFKMRQDVADSVCESAPQNWSVKPETMEITSIFAGAGVLILVVGAGLSLLWFSRLQCNPCRSGAASLTETETSCIGG